MIGDEEETAEAFEGQAAVACLELRGGGGDGEASFASSSATIVISLRAHYSLSSSSNNSTAASGDSEQCWLCFALLRHFALCT